MTKSSSKLEAIKDPKLHIFEKMRQESEYQHNKNIQCIYEWVITLYIDPFCRKYKLKYIKGGGFHWGSDTLWADEFIQTNPHRLYISKLFAYHVMYTEEGEESPFMYDRDIFVQEFLDICSIIQQPSLKDMDKCICDDLEDYIP